MIAKSRKVAYYSLVFLGIFGAHRFYLKKPYAILLLINGLVCIACLFYIVKVTGTEYLNVAQQLSNPTSTLSTTNSSATNSVPLTAAGQIAASTSRAALSNDLSGLSGMHGKIDFSRFDPLLLWVNILYMITSVLALAVCAFDLFQISKWIPRGHYYDNVTRGYTVQ